MKLFILIVSLFFLHTSCLLVRAQSFNSKNGKKLFSFGLIADIQYADVEKTGNRDYRNSLNKLENCIEEFNRQNLSFIITLGDMIDRDYVSFNKPMDMIKELNAPVYNVIGNHDFSVDDQFKKEVKKRLHNKNGYFEFKKGDFEFIILDGTDISEFATTKESSKYQIAMKNYEKLKAIGANNAYLWNGGIGEKQLNWLETKLKKADKNNRKVILFCHWPLLPENGTQLWNNKEVLNLINNHDCVIAWIAGHHHAGGYEKKGQIHFLTIKGMVEAKYETSCGIIDVYSDKLFLNGYGDQKSLTLKFPGN